MYIEPIRRNSLIITPSRTGGQVVEYQGEDTLLCDKAMRTAACRMRRLFVCSPSATNRRASTRTNYESHNHQTSNNQQPDINLIH